ncbi:MAG: SH3 domain-containing protein [Cyanobacteria bacterium CRU_2_1]|nr:SH3 domain-containing protein [Cyanobacteria bacterium RU_5_0]NJR62666.1 SH3 domain-containing protein [Cyanobacteria bacterium CRU_2_1]
MSITGGESLRQAKAIALDTQKKSWRDQLSESNSQNLYRIRLNQRSSLDLQLKNTKSNTTVELVQDRNRNGRIDRKELVSRSGVSKNQGTGLRTDTLNQGTYFIRVSSTADRRTNYQLVLSTNPVEKNSTAQRNGWSATGNSKSESEYQPVRRTLGGAVRVPGDTRNRDGGGNTRNPGNSSNNNNNNNSNNNNSNDRPVSPSRKESPTRWNGRFLNRTSGNVNDYKTYNFNNANAYADLGSRGGGGKRVARLKIDYGNRGPRDIQNDNFAMESWTRVKLKEGRFYKVTTKSNDGTRFYFKDYDTDKLMGELSGDWRDRDTSDAAWSQVISVSKTDQYKFFVQYYERTGKSAVNVTLEEVKPTGRANTSGGLNLRSKASTIDNSPIRMLNSNETFTIVRQIKSSNDNNYPDWYEVETRNGRGYVAAELVTVDGAGNIVALGGDNRNSGTPNPGRGRDDGGGLSNPIPDNNTGNGGTVGGGSTGGTDLKTYSFTTTIPRENGAFKPHLDEILSPYYHTTSYKSYIEESALKYDWLQPSVIAAIGSRESAWGILLSPRGPGGTGDGGHGRGLMQIDDRFHQDFIYSGKWADPRENIMYGIDKVLAPNYNYLDQNTNLQGTELLRAALASYNAGLGNVMDAYESGLDSDSYTTGRDYGWDVLDRAGWFQLQGWV